MSEAQIPLMVVMGFLGGCFAGAWAFKRISLAIILLMVAIVLDMAGWMTYGFIVNWEPSWGIGHVIFGVLYVGPGMILFITVPAIIGFALSILIVKFISVNAKRNAVDKRT